MALRQGKSTPLQEDIDPDYEPSVEGASFFGVLLELVDCSVLTAIAFWQKSRIMPNGLALT